jgi:hypothetical protein
VEKFLVDDLVYIGFWNDLEAGEMLGDILAPCWARRLLLLLDVCETEAEEERAGRAEPDVMLLHMREIMCGIWRENV